MGAARGMGPAHGSPAGRAEPFGPGERPPGCSGVPRVPLGVCPALPVTCAVLALTVLSRGAGAVRSSSGDRTVP